MKAEVKELWLKALRSGEYKQGTGQLVEVLDSGVRRYCCLGVLCDVAVKNGLELVVNEDEDGVTYDRQGALLPRRVVDWAELRDALNSIGARFRLDELEDGATGAEFAIYVDPDGTGSPEDLAGLNDSGNSFLKIADLIEKGI